MSAKIDATMPRPSIDLRLGDWRTVLADVGEVDAVITDPPYSERTHLGHRAGVGLTGSGGPTTRNDLSYANWGADDVRAFVATWARRNRGWFVCLSDHSLIPHYEAAFEDVGLTTFQPLPCVITGMSVRLAGDGPSSWAVYANVARPKSLARWGTLPGAYTGPASDRLIVGGKPLWLMRALVRDYSRAGDLICDPLAGAATTLVAAFEKDRRSVGAEIDPETRASGLRRIARTIPAPSDVRA